MHLVMDLARILFRRRPRRGIFLISVLFFSLLIIMFVDAALRLAPSSLARAGADASLTSADLAAKSGIDWARNRISLDSRWNASTPQNFSAPGFVVKEGDGLVEGWLHSDSGWSRFRFRFNYQDGPQSSSPNSDNMNDPPAAAMWTDFPYVSCNNLLGGTQLLAPLAVDGQAYANPSPWPRTQTTVPSGTMLLSVEGASGTVTTNGGRPTGFAAGVHTRTVQTILKFGDNQPITNAAIMSAGDIAINLYGATLQLSSVGSQTARLRTKDHLNLGDVASSNADLRYGPTGMTSGTLSSGITSQPDGGGDGFYKIPASKVRTPSSALALNAGVYVVTKSGQILYHNMDYATFVATSPAPTGTPFTLPAGMTLVGPNTTGPKFRINVTSDLKISAATPGVSDFALIPDGGAPQSTAYGGVAAAPAPQAPVAAFTRFLTSASTTLSVTQSNAWRAILNPLGLGAMPGPASTIFIVPGGGTIGAPNGAGILDLSGISVTDLDRLLANADPVALQALQGEYAYGGASSTGGTIGGGSTPGTGLLKPADLELNLQGGSGGLTVANDFGSIVIGSQIKGNGAAMTSKKDISLIGTSSDLSSDPGAALGLNLYARGTITVDAFKLDSGGATFHSINMRGIAYAWQGINILAGNTTSAAPFNMVGTMVAYGGDPAGPVNPGTARTLINANAATIKFDPSFAASLLQSGPFTLQVMSWHEF